MLLNPHVPRDVSGLHIILSHENLHQFSAYSMKNLLKPELLLNCSNYAVHFRFY